MQAFADVMRPNAPQAQGVPIPPEVPRFVEPNVNVPRNEMARNRGDYGRVLKTITSLRPDNYDGKGEPVRAAHWFSHMERLFRNVDCTEAEKVQIASLQLKEEASEWWENTGLSDRADLSWAMFKTKMMDRFFSRSMRDEKHKEFMHPEIEGLKVTELVTKFNHLLQYAGSDVTSEEQKIWHFHEWMGPDIKYS